MDCLSDHSNLQFFLLTRTSLHKVHPDIISVSLLRSGLSVAELIPLGVLLSSISCQVSSYLYFYGPNNLSDADHNIYNNLIPDLAQKHNYSPFHIDDNKGIRNLHMLNNFSHINIPFFLLKGNCLNRTRTYSFYYYRYFYS